MIESIPNVSEGTRTAVVEDLAAAVGRAGATLLDHSADPSHDRSVFTIVGDADQLESALLRLYEIAVSRIDLGSHKGVHPRIGAVDVVPFVPLGDETMSRCIALSRTLGASVAERFGVPVFLYEESASRPERQRLEAIRRGGLVGLAARMASEAVWAPDFGPSAPHRTAGATVIGARRPLIAFNVNLDSTDLAAARSIAAAVRESSGGLPAVKALGLSLAHRGLVQVSMNLTDFRRTGVERAFGEVERLADQRGIRVKESELVGLIPAAALAGTSAERLKLTGFTSDRILEERIARRLGRQ